VDALAVIGGGVSQAWPLFLPALMAEVNGSYTLPDGNTFPRLNQKVFNLEEPDQLEKFLQGDVREILVPGSGRK